MSFFGFEDDRYIMTSNYSLIGKRWAVYYSNCPIYLYDKIFSISPLRGPVGPELQPRKDLVIW